MSTDLPAQRSVLRWVWPLGAVVAVVLYVMIHALTQGPPVPSSAKAESFLAEDVGRREQTTVTATCAPPTGVTWRCRLHTADGRRGWANGTLKNRKERAGRYIRKVYWSSYEWGFTVDVNGAVSLDVAVKDGLEPRYAMTLAADRIAWSLGTAAPGLNDVTCPSVAIGDTVVCQGAPSMQPARLTRTAINGYHISGQVTVPIK